MKKDEIKFDENNYRVHDPENKALIKKSLLDCGAGRSILIDAENKIIAGNGVYEQAKEIGLKVKIIETTGEELIVNKRIDLKPEAEKTQEMQIIDNSAAASSRFTIKVMQNDFDIPSMQELGVKVYEPSEVDASSFFTEATEKKAKTYICPCCGKEFKK